MINPHLFTILCFSIIALIFSIKAMHFGKKSENPDPHIAHDMRFNAGIFSFISWFCILIALMITGIWNSKVWEERHYRDQPKVKVSE